MSRTPPRNRLAKPLPDRWRYWLVDEGVPKRKYTAVVTVALADGRRVDEVIIEEGWIVAIGLERLADDVFEQAIDFDPLFIEAVELVQAV